MQSFFTACLFSTAMPSALMRRPPPCILQRAFETHTNTHTRHVQARPNYLRFTACGAPLILIITYCSNEYCFLDPKDLLTKLYSDHKKRTLIIFVCNHCVVFKEDLFRPHIIMFNVHVQCN
jgi:hypothetical protein